MTSRKPTSTMTPAIWACAGVLGLNLVLGSSGINSAIPASAEQPGNNPGTTNQPDPPFNAADQRKRMIEQLTSLNDRMSRIEAKLDKGISVKVTEMPAVKSKD